MATLWSGGSSPISKLWKEFSYVFVFLCRVTANYADGELSFVGSVSHPVHDRFAHYEDAIAVIDISPLLQHFRPWRWQNSTVSLWIVKDVCGVICTLLTWLLLVFAEFVMWTCILLPSKDRSHSFVHGVIFQGFTCLAAFSHLRAMFTNPVCAYRRSAYFCRFLIDFS